MAKIGTVAPMSSSVRRGRMIQRALAALNAHSQPMQPRTGVIQKSSAHSHE